MTKYCVTFVRDWADEFTACGLAILDDDGIANLHNWLEKDAGFYFGTNEGYEEGEITIDDFTLTSITDQEEEILNRLVEPGREKCSIYKQRNCYNIIYSGKYADKIISELKMVNVQRMSRKWDKDDYVDTEEVS